MSLLCHLVVIAGAIAGAKVRILGKMSYKRKQKLFYNYTNLLSCWNADDRYCMKDEVL